MASLGRDISHELIAKYAFASTAVTAAGSGDATEIVGLTIDTQALPTKAESVAFLVSVLASLTATKNITIAAHIQDSADDSTYADVVASQTILTLSATGTNRGTGKIGVNLNLCRRYIRIYLTPDMSASGTDTATVTGIAVFGGLQEQPQS